MKLLYIHQYFNFPENSGSTRSYDLASSFVKEGIDVIMLSTNRHPSPNTPKWEEMERDGIKFYFLSCPYDNKMGFVRRIMSFLRFIIETTKKAKTLDFDVILATSTPLTVGYPALVLKRKLKKPYIFEVRDVWPFCPIAMGYFKNKLVQKLLYAFELKIYRKASAIVPLSVGMDANIMARYPNDKSVVIPNISEINRFANPVKSVDIVPVEGSKILLYAGTCGKVNGIGYVVNLAEKTWSLDKNVVYYIVGDGKEKDKLIQDAKNKGILGKNLFFFDSVKKSDLPYLYSIATVGSSFVIDNPAMWENSAQKFFDTLAAARPMVINHEGWQADTIRQHNCGYVLPPVVTANVAKDFVAYMNDNALHLTQGKNAFELAVREYSLDVAVEKYMSVFEEKVSI